MGTPRRKSILDNVQTSLEAIDGSGDYKTTVATVKNYLVPFDHEELGAASMPWVGYMPGLERFTPRPNKQMISVMPLTVLAHVNTTFTNKTANLTDLQDDIIAALGADTTRGGYAVRTTLRESQTDEGDDTSYDRHGGTGTIAMTFEIEYRRHASSS